MMEDQLNNYKIIVLHSFNGISALAHVTVMHTYIARMINNNCNNYHNVITEREVYT